MFAYFDIETTGLTDASTFVCAVADVDGTVQTFGTLVSTVAFLLETKATIVTWNGLAFDFKFLADRTSDEVTKGRLAWVAMNRHIDIMLDFLTDHGYPTSMQSVAKPLGLSKTWSGAEAAESADYVAVLEYCKDDVQVLRSIHESGMKQPWLDRLTAAGKRTVWVLPREGFRTANECLQTVRALPPDQGWMSEPFNISGTAVWVHDALALILR
jgi:uncharacterized protein YprB with RNaseH-like and TPR domain